MRCVEREVGDQRFGEALHRELRGAIRGMRTGRPERGPETVDAAGVDDVVRVGLLHYRQEGAGAVVDAAPAHVERPLPLLAAVGDHAAAAANSGVVEQQVDLVGVVAVCDLIAKSLYLRRVGHVGDMVGDAQALRQSRRFAETLRFRHRRRRDVAHRDVAGLRDQLADEFPPHPRAAAGDDRGPPSEFLHVCSSLGLLQGVEARNSRTNRHSAHSDHSAAMGRVARE